MRVDPVKLIQFIVCQATEFGASYRSPSLAAASKRATCNGWTFWKYERAPSDWVKLNELRK
jgi:hypothetical protein